MMRALNVLALGLVTLAASTASAAIIQGDVADSLANGAGVNDPTIQPGSFFFFEQRTYVSVFQLPDVDAIANPFSAATLSLYLNSAGGTGWVQLAFHGTSARVLPTVLGSDAGGGSALNFSLTTSAAVGEFKSISNASLLTFLNTEYAVGAGANKYVFFSSRPTDVGDASWSFETANSATPANRPTLDVTVIPEPTSLGLLGASALFGLRRRRA